MELLLIPTGRNLPGLKSPRIWDMASAKEDRPRVLGLMQIRTLLVEYHDSQYCLEVRMNRTGAEYLFEGVTEHALYVHAVQRHTDTRTKVVYLIFGAGLGRSAPNVLHRHSAGFFAHYTANFVITPFSTA
jgi:hypothetical protein